MSSAAELFVTGLSRCGWFEDLPPQFREAVRDRLNSLASDDSWQAVVDVWETKDGELQHGLDELLDAFARCSQGLLQPERIELDEGCHRLSFTHAGRDYHIEVPSDCDMTGDNPVEECVNRALFDAGCRAKFCLIHDEDYENVGWALTNPRAVERAIERRLIPGG